ncbi:hypothetical protein [Sneathiella litorea]|uniref:Uncharacterized protein n=1 Tax=Sneathiella litorea TaxID=2606216 RepID=A0A6L8WCD4_9PROT|nr:hypothetical protein [Sneathiella litorea]MZR32080.1 hypothetical protein [Sneathiella litorea]
MQKFVTVLLIFIMLSMPARFAAASGGDGGGMVILNTISAFAKPEVFTLVVLTNFFIVNTAFSPIISQLPPAVRSKYALTLTAVLTLNYFRYAMLEFTRYFLYALFSPGFYFQENPDSRSVATPEKAQEGLWSASNPDVMTNAVAQNEEKEKQELINKAVQAALRDPEIARKYLEYSTPEVKAAVTKALENQAADRARF